MSDLQSALIALGALIIAGVVLYNWLQERKMRKNITDEFLVPQKDVLAEDFYIDSDAYMDKTLADMPNKSKITEKLHEIESASDIKSSELPAAEVDEEVDEPDIKPKQVAAFPRDESKSEPAFHIPPIDKTIPLSAQPQAPKHDAHNEVPSLSSPLPDEIHPQIDLTAFLYAPKNLNAQTLNTMANGIADEMGVPMIVHGLDQDDKWHVVNSASNADKTLKQISCSMQLADRGGPVSKHLLNKFQFSIENMGLELGAHVEWQGSGDAMQRAIDLDKFCMEVDQLVSVHLMQGETPVHGTKFRGLAESCGMRLGEDGKFYFFAPTNPDTPQFILINSDNQPFTSESLRSSVVIGATFQIEIPKVSNCDQVFSQMVQVAQKMANSLGARMVDDNKKPLGDLQVEKIRQQLKVIHATMLARGVMPGSPSSARLFN
ncbi:MAG: cell division protein ZipA C-terminal FtsZ-binding domain-containing protein [Methylophilaceae bacterium]